MELNKEENSNSKINASESQNQIHEIVFNREIGWQEIIYDLINTEQLDPWDVDIVLLTNKYLEKINQLEEADFFVSSKVLLAASFLLRIKSEFLLNRYIKSIDEILFGKKQEKISRGLERIELDEDIPFLIPRSPMPRFKKVTLKELIESLNKAIITENRRIKKEIVKSNALRETAISLPKRTVNIQDKINDLHSRLKKYFEQNSELSISFTKFIGNDKEERVLSFYPLLQLENNQKIWMHQEEHFNEINLWMKETFLKNNGDPFEQIKKELEEINKEIILDEEAVIDEN